MAPSAKSGEDLRDRTEVIAVLDLNLDHVAPDARLQFGRSP